MSSDAEDATLRFLGDLESMVVRPGDMFLLTIPQCVTLAQREAIRGYWDDFMLQALGQSPPLLILSDGITLSKVNVQELLRDAGVASDENPTRSASPAGQQGGDHGQP